MAKRRIFSMRRDRPDIFLAFVKRGRRHARHEDGDECKNCLHWLPSEWCPIQKGHQEATGLCALHEKASEIETDN